MNLPPRKTTARVVETLIDLQSSRHPGARITRSDLADAYADILNFPAVVAYSAIQAAVEDDAIHVDRTMAVRLRADIDAGKGASVTTPALESVEEYLRGTPDVVTGPMGGTVGWHKGVTVETGGETALRGGQNIGDNMPVPDEPPVVVDRGARRREMLAATEMAPEGNAEDSDLHPLYGARESKAPEGANSAREAAEKALEIERERYERLLEAEQETTRRDNYRMACLDLMRAMLARRDMTAGTYSELACTIAKLMEF